MVRSLDGEVAIVAQGGGTIVTVASAVLRDHGTEIAFNRDLGAPEGQP